MGWLPATVPAEPCPDPSGPPVATVAPPPATAKPPKPKDCSGQTAYVKAQKLKMKKKVAKAMDCQIFCATVNGANYFKWKNNKQVKKRVCLCQKVSLGFKKSKGKSKFISGPLAC